MKSRIVEFRDKNYPPYYHTSPSQYPIIDMMLIRQTDLFMIKAQLRAETEEE